MRPMHFRRSLFGTVVGACIATTLLLVFHQQQVSSPHVQGQELVKKYPNEEFNASIVQVLAHRDKYHGKHVRIMGYLRVEFEGTAIYLSKEDAEYGMTRNGFWVSFDRKAVPYEGIVGPVKFDRKYVLIEGTFNKHDLGHMTLWQGAIEGVDRIMELERHP